MPNQIDDDQPRHDTTHAVAHLPGLDIEVTHRRAPDAESILIHLQAVPSFAAFGKFLDDANPFAFWAEAVRLAWMPWLPWLPWRGATHALMPPAPAHETPPTVPES